MTQFKIVRLMARRPGMNWGIRSMMNEENKRQFIPDHKKEHLSQAAVEALAHELAVTWSDRVKDGTEYKVVAE